MTSDCEVGDRVIYHDPTPLHGVFHAIVTRRVTMPSGAVPAGIGCNGLVGSVDVAVKLYVPPPLGKPIDDVGAVPSVTVKLLLSGVEVSPLEDAVSL